MTLKIGDKVMTKRPRLTGTIIGPCSIGRDNCWRIKFDHDEKPEWDEKEMNLEPDLMATLGEAYSRSQLKRFKAMKQEICKEETAD